MVLNDELTALAGTHAFSGSILVWRSDEVVAATARGMADRAHERPNTLATRFGVASVTKGLTALTVASLIETGALEPGATLRAIVGDDLPNVDPRVTIEHLLGHTSGVGDYLDEEELSDIDDYVMTEPVHRLESATAYLPMVAAPSQRTSPGERFAYNNGGYVMLSIAVERATGRPFHDLVRERVLDPAGMADSGLFRSDRLPGGTAFGYLADGRTNVLHLPVRGAGDGGAWSTAGDLRSLWRALFDGRIVSASTRDWLIAPRTDVPGGKRRYALGFWLRADRDTLILEGLDAGISCRTAFDPSSGAGYAVLANDSSGAWPPARFLDERLAELTDIELPSGTATVER